MRVAITMLLLAGIMLFGYGALTRPLCAASSDGCAFLRAAVKSELLKLDSAQADFHSRHDNYAATPEELDGYEIYGGITLTITQASDSGFVATGTHESWPAGECVMAVGNLATEGQPSSRPVCTGDEEGK